MHLGLQGLVKTLKQALNAAENVIVTSIVLAENENYNHKFVTEQHQFQSYFIFIM